MLEYNHLKIPETLKELLNKKSIAILIIDMQNDFCSEGFLAENRDSIDINIYKKVIKNIKEVIRNSRNKKIPIFWVSTITKRDLSSDSSSWFRFRLGLLGYKNKKIKDKLINFDINKEYLLESSFGAKIIDDLSMQKKDIRIIKYRSSAFYNTNLQKIMESKKIKTIVIAGIYSYGCVLSTAIDAMFRDYFTVVLSDCIIGPDKDLDTFAKKFLNERTDLISSKTFINTLV